MTDYDWTQATDVLLATVLGMTDAAAADRIGVSEPTINRWRALRKAREPIAEPRGKPREALLSLLERNETTDGPSVRPDVPFLDGGGLAELYRRIDLIEASNAPDWLKTLRTDSLAAVVRAEAMRQAELAGLARADAIRTARADAVREITSARKDVGEPLTNADALERIRRRQQPKQDRVAGE